MKEIQPEDIWNEDKYKILSIIILNHKTKDLVKNTPNDQELGAEIRKLFS